MGNVYELNNVCKTYKNDGKEFTALKGVSLEVKEGEIFGIIGMSGAGKSTLVRTLNRLEEVTSGTVSFYGKDLASLKPAELREVRHSISMIFQGFNLLNQRTVIQNVEQSLKIIGTPREKRRKKAEQMLEIVGLLEKRNEYPARLSGGQKQRVAIARALAADPKVLLCDEVTSALDVSVQAQILHLLSDLRKELNLSILFISHDMQVVRALSDLVLVMYFGKIVERGEAGVVLTDPKHEYTRKLLAAVPTIRR